jgi:hypothetical protein
MTAETELRRPPFNLRVFAAYLRPGGAAPLCYPTDVTAAMIEAYRQRMASR